MKLNNNSMCLVTFYLRLYMQNSDLKTLTLYKAQVLTHSKSLHHYIHIA